MCMSCSEMNKIWIVGTAKTVCVCGEGGCCNISLEGERVCARK